MKQAFNGVYEPRTDDARHRAPTNRPRGRESDEVMCEKCNELDDKIAHYKRLAVQITDKLTLDGIDQLINRLRSEKVDLHGERHQE